MADMLGRTPRSIQSIVHSYNLERHRRYRTPGEKLTPEQIEDIKRRMVSWIEDEHLTIKDMHRRVCAIYGVDLSYPRVAAIAATLPHWVQETRKAHLACKKSRNTERYHTRRRLRAQQ